MASNQERITILPPGPKPAADPIKTPNRFVSLEDELPDDIEAWGCDPFEILALREEIEGKPINSKGAMHPNR